MSWFRPAGSLAQGDADVVVTPDTAPWAYSGMRVWTLEPGRTITHTLDGEEGVLVPLSARDVAVTVDDESLTMTGRDGVFDAVSDWVYVPVGSTITLSGNGGDSGLPAAAAQ